MPHSIVLISKSGLDSWMGESILKKDDFSVTSARSLQEGFQAIQKGPCDLFIVEEWPEEPRLIPFIESLRFDIPNPKLRGIVLATVTSPALQGKPVERILVLPVTLETFNAAVARALSLPVRAHRRYLVRMHLGVVGGNANLLATLVTVNISAGGLLVESTKELPVGQTFMWSFSGARTLEGLSIPGRILREIEPEQHGKLRHYAIQFDDAAQEQTEALGLYLAQQTDQPS